MCSTHVFPSYFRVGNCSVRPYVDEIRRIPCSHAVVVPGGRLGQRRGLVVEGVFAAEAVGTWQSGHTAVKISK